MTFGIMGKTKEQRTRELRTVRDTVYEMSAIE